jgi:hypothetical protein
MRMGSQEKNTKNWRKRNTREKREVKPENGRKKKRNTPHLGRIYNRNQGNKSNTKRQMEIVTLQDKKQEEKQNHKEEKKLKNVILTRSRP